MMKKRKKLSAYKTISENCVVCSNGHFSEPNSSHKCIMCEKAVHVVTGCFEQMNEDQKGFGERRIC